MPDRFLSSMGAPLALIAVAIPERAASQATKIEQVVAPVVDAIRGAQAEDAALPPPATKRELLERLGRLDQAGREHIDAIDFDGLSLEERIEVRRVIAAAMEPVDRANATKLRGGLPVDGWFARAEFGDEAADAAFHVVQHSGDLALMKLVLPRLQIFAERGEIDGFDFAAMFDRVATKEGRGQRYGTQFRCAGGRIEPYPLEDPSKVEERRRALRLEQSFEESNRAHSGKPCI